MQKTPRLLVIDPSLHSVEEQGVAEVLQGWKHRYLVIQPAFQLEEMTALKHDDLDGVVVMGSGASVHDDLPWLNALKAWMLPILSGEVALPLLGICFGHQLIAHLQGGEVGFLREDESKRRGVEVSTLSDSRLLENPSQIRVIVSHREAILALPRGYEAIATRPGVSFDGIQHIERPIFSFQFHPEAREDFAAKGENIAPEEIDAGLKSDGQSVLGAFRTLVLQRAQGGV